MHTSRRGFIGMAAALGFGGRAVAAGRNSDAHSGAARPAGTEPWPLYRSESFTMNWRDRVLQIGIARPLDVLPDVPLMLQGYKPVPVYVLDGSFNLPIVVGTVRHMQWGGEAPPCLVVGIDYLDADQALREDWRTRELTPTVPKVGYDADSKTPMGNASAFREFIVGTLRPLIERRFEVDAARSVLVGHSLGGLFTLDTMLRAPDAFGNYLATSPSLWFDDGMVLRAFREKLAGNVVFKSRVVALAGEQEERIAPPETRMTSNTLEFGRLVAEHRAKFPGGALVSVLPNTTHHTMLGTGIARGMRFLIAPEDRRTETF